MRWVRRILLGLSALVLALVATAYYLLSASLPQLDGTVGATELVAPVTIERDAQGVATLTAGNRADLAYATGYAHGQDRFFQMDLQRRAAAGELAALLGADFVAIDKRLRRHNFRAVASGVIAQASVEQRHVIERYVAGVNDALNALRARPFEYLMLQVEPAPWTVEDSVLVAFAMYLDLNDAEGRDELERARLHNALPPEVYAALYPRGSEWEAPLDGVDLSRALPPVPSAESLDLRTTPPLSPNGVGSAKADVPGSNSWALAGYRTANGSALMANDMHLSLRIPHIWYRARMIVKSDDPALARDLTGVTLPGMPMLVAGSNGRVAWGFTNSYGDYDDLVLLQVDPSEPNRYRVADGFREFAIRKERIDVRGGDPIDVEFRDTIWGPMLDEDLDGQPLALAWTAQFAEATNIQQLALEAAGSAEEALAIAQTAGIPVQNFIAADTNGNIGWTLIGKLPKREGFDGRLPVCWGCADNVGWRGWVSSSDYPRILNPPRGQLWTANSRTLGAPVLGEGIDVMGEESMDRGARARQIRDGLEGLQRATPRDMLAVQLDDRAVFLKRWRDILVNLQDDAYLRGFPARRVAMPLVERWSDHASIDDPGYRIVRAARAAIVEDIYADLTSQARKRYPKATFRPSARFEDTAWQILTMQPQHLLNPEFGTWDLRVLASFDRAIEALKKECDVDDRRLHACTWGDRNTLDMEHPFASIVPGLGRWLRMPRVPLPGDRDMPRVQGPSFGASERFAVSPGHESEGYFHMPGGQSGHPLSPYFDAGHEAWVRGEASPFLPGPAQHTLTLADQ